MMVWLKKLSVSAFQNFLQIENQLNIKEVMGKKHVDVFCINSVHIDSIECITDPCPVSTVSTYSIDDIDGMVEKPSVSAFQNFLQIEKSRVLTPHSALYKVLCKSHKHQCIDSLDKHSIQCIVCFDLCIESVNKQDTIHNTQ